MERKAGPIYIYDDDENLLKTYKYYINFLKKTQQRLIDSDLNISLPQALEKLHSLVFYSFTHKTLNKFIVLNKKLTGKTRSTYDLIYCLSKGLTLIGQHMEYSIHCWAKTSVLNSIKFRPSATLRIRGLLRFLMRSEKPDEDIIINSAKKIAQIYKQHSHVRVAILDEEIKEAHGRQIVGANASLVYNVSPEIKKFIKGEERIPEEHSTFTEFIFPSEDFQQKCAKIRLDPAKSKIIIGEEREEIGALLIKDVSSVVLNEKPLCFLEAPFWVRINGRKIPKSQSLCKQR